MKVKKIRGSYLLNGNKDKLSNIDILAIIALDEF
jgi:hypothetical protein